MLVLEVPNADLSYKPTSRKQIQSQLQTNGKGVHILLKLSALNGESVIISIIKDFYWETVIAIIYFV